MGVHFYAPLLYRNYPKNASGISNNNIVLENRWHYSIFTAETGVLSKLAINYKTFTAL